MAGPYTPNYLLEVPAAGDPSQRNAWGSMENEGRTLVDTALGGNLSLSVAGLANVVLTSIPGEADQARFAHYIFTGTLTGNIFVLWPQNVGRSFSVSNQTTGAFTLGCGANDSAGAPAGTTITIPQGGTVILYSDGTNVVFRYGLLTNGNLLVGTTALGSGTGSGTNIIIGTPATDNRLVINSNINTQLGLINGSQAAFFGLNNNANFVFANNLGTPLASIDGVSGAYTALSDERMKTKRAEQINYRAAIGALWIGDFDWSRGGERGFGLMAQQAYEVMPGGLGVVKPENPADDWHVNPATFGYLALWGVKDLYAMIGKMESRISELESR